MTEISHANRHTLASTHGLVSVPQAPQPTHRLECWDANAPWLINFFEPEQHEGKQFRWTEPVAMVRLQIQTASYDVIIETGSLRGEACNFRFELVWNAHSIPRSAIQIAQGQIRFRVHADMFVANVEQRLTIACSPLNAENGRRQLGMPICWIELKAVPASEVETSRSVNRAKIVRFPDPRSGLRRLIPRKSPTPSIPIWQVKLPTVAASLTTRNLALNAGQRYCEQVIISPVEINSRHGTGLLIRHLLGDLSTFATVASLRCYNDDRFASAVHHYLPSNTLARHEIYEHVLQWFAAAPPRQAYAVPFFASDMFIAMALKDLFGTQVCLHIMDDNCLYASEIPQSVAAEAIEKSELCLAISPEMRGAYEQRFGKRIGLLPPIVPAELIDEGHSEVESLDSTVRPAGWTRRAIRAMRQLWPFERAKADESSRRGILIGNVWDRQWLDLLRDTVRKSGLQVDWYCNNPDAVWLQDSTQNLSFDGIHVRPALWGAELVAELRRRPFALMPSGRLGEGGARESIARLSLPSRLPFVVATASLPIIVLGSRETSAARFVQRFELGSVIDYVGVELKKAASEIMGRNCQQQIRSRARSIARRFSSAGAAEWLWKSLAAGEPCDDRFEALFTPQPGEFTRYFDTAPPANMHWSFRSTWQMLRRLRDQGINPEIVIDVGSSTGIWSWTAATVFRNARFVLVDPMMSRYDEKERRFYNESIGRCETVEAALSDRCGQMEMLVSDDLYGSSLLKVDESLRKSESVRVNVLTLDEMARRMNLRGRTLLKIDVQFAEHLVLAGGRNFISNHVDALVLELTLRREHSHAKTYREMLDLMESLGYELLDETEGWRNPQDGRLQQKDSVFIRAPKLTVAKAA